MGFAQKQAAPGAPYPGAAATQPRAHPSYSSLFLHDAGTAARETVGRRGGNGF